MMEGPQTELLLLLKNQICQQLEEAQAALVSGQWSQERGGGAIIKADRVPLFI